MSRPRSTTTSVAFGTATTMPLVPETSTPASELSEEMVIGLVIVTAPKPPGSSTLISPLGAVFEMAPAKVLQGAVRLHGFASSPTPETQVRVACAWARELQVTKRTSAVNAWRVSFLGFITNLLLDYGFSSTSTVQKRPHYALVRSPSRDVQSSLFGDAAVVYSRRSPAFRYRRLVALLSLDFSHAQALLESPALGAEPAAKGFRGLR